MVKFPKSKCPRCGRNPTELMINNNPLLAGTSTICFDCIAEMIDEHNIDKVDLFCRTYNLPLKPDLWIELNKTSHGAALFKQYTTIILEDKTLQPNLYYQNQTHDLWAMVNKEWLKTRSFAELLARLEPIKESYTTRGQLKWGDQYTFEDILQLDSVYTRTIKANNIVNPIQKEAIKTLCKLQLQLNAAIREGDSKGIKDYSSAYGIMAKQADLENMIAETKTSDITTVAELSDYLEKTGFQPKFYDGFDRDEVDTALHDMNNTLRKTINESTSIQPLLEEMARKKQEAEEDKQTKEATDVTSMQDLMDYNPEETEEVAHEADSDVTDLKFEPDAPDDLTAPVKISHEESKELTGDGNKDLTGGDK